MRRLIVAIILPMLLTIALLVKVSAPRAAGSRNDQMFDAPGLPNVCGGFKTLAASTGTLSLWCLRPGMVCVASDFSDATKTANAKAPTSGAVSIGGTSGDVLEVACVLSNGGATPTTSATPTVTATASTTSTPTSTPTP